jgi:integrase
MTWRSGLKQEVSKRKRNRDTFALLLKRLQPNTNAKEQTMTIYRRGLGEHRGRPVKSLKEPHTLTINFTYKGKRYIKALPGITSLTRAKDIEEKWRAQIILEDLTGVSHKPVDDITFEDFVHKIYLPHSKQSKKSYALDVHYAKFTCAYFKGKRLRDITSADIEEYRHHRKSSLTRNGKERQGNTVNREIGQLGSVFTLAVKRQKITANPVSGIQPYRVTSRRIRVLDEAEKTKLMEGITPKHEQYRPCILLALHTGMRLGEVARLEWGFVDLSNRRIELPSSVTKNSEGRTLLLNDVALACLSELRASSEGNGRVFKGKGYGREKIGTKVRGLCNEIGLAGVGMHVFRHTFASDLDKAGVSQTTIQRLMGHKRQQMTSHYTHKNFAEYFEAVKKLEKSPASNADVSQETRELLKAISNSLPQQELARA